MMPLQLLKDIFTFSKKKKKKISCKTESLCDKPGLDSAN